MMKKTKTKFKNLIILENKVYKDNRGNLREAYNNKYIKKKITFIDCIYIKKKCIKRFTLAS